MTLAGEYCTDFLDQFPQVFEFVCVLIFDLLGHGLLSFAVCIEPSQQWAIAVLQRQHGGEVIVKASFKHSQLREPEIRNCDFFQFATSHARRFGCGF